MILRHIALGAIALGLGGVAWLACGASARPPAATLLPEPAAAPPDIQAACQLTTQRCSHCHPIDRLVVARGIGMRRWQLFVDEMRLKPSSGISLADAQVVLRCLRFTEEPAVPPPPPSSSSDPGSDPGSAPGPGSAEGRS